MTDPVLDSMKAKDVRDSMFSVIRGLNPESLVAVAGLMNVLGAVIAEQTKADPAFRQRVLDIVHRTLPNYVDAYTRGDNPLRT